MAPDELQRFAEQETISVAAVNPSGQRIVLGGSGAGQSIDQTGKCTGGVWHEFRELINIPGGKNVIVDRCPRCHATFSLNLNERPFIWMPVGHQNKSEDQRLFDDGLEQEIEEIAKRIDVLLLELTDKIEDVPQLADLAKIADQTEKLHILALTESEIPEHIRQRFSTK